MSEVLRILDELQRDHSGDPWHGSCVTDILRGVTASQAAARAVPHVHTVWELVLHMTAWKREVRQRLRGAPAGQPAEGDWPEVGATTPEHWAEALANLDAAHEALIAAARELPESQLFEPTNDPRNRPLGTGVSRYVLLHGLVQHDAYHAGQLALLIKVMRMS
jgi:uncharacterized damage-inducible protein DinB